MKHLTTALALGLCALAGPAAADETVKQCLREARGQAKFCRAECRENHRMDKDECRAVDHECAEVCRAERNECLVDIYADLESCHTPCSQDRAAAVEQCRLDWPPRTQARERCIRVAKLAGYRCDSECRVGVNDEIKECRVEHRQCLDDCRRDLESGTD